MIRVFFLISLLLLQQETYSFLPNHQQGRCATFLASSTQKKKPTEKETNKDKEPSPTELLENAFSKAYTRKDDDFDDEPVLLTDDNEERERPETVDIPKTGISVSDTIMDNERDVYTADLIPIGRKLPGVAMIRTEPEESGGFDPIRYLVALTPPTNVTRNVDYVLTDIPPFSETLASNIRQFVNGGKLVAMLLTCRNAIHYDEGPAVYTARNSHLQAWVSAFPEMEVVGYRLDVPRYGSSLFTQKLNGYGPWGWNNATNQFEETGRPLVSKEWDTTTIQMVLKQGMIPMELEDDDEEMDDENEDQYSPEAIRKREEGKGLLAVYTPGSTHGTLTYVFPRSKVVVSGFTIPIEDIPQDGREAGPALDARGYITTSSAGMVKQMASARKLVLDYVDRFSIILSARSNPEFLDDLNEEERKYALLNLIDQYEEIGVQYENAGIDDDEDDDEEDDDHSFPKP